ncbi:MAG: PAS domain S-box protein [Gammaproteobacteria bacterium]|nr:PAS domain S-box protein [Gammaproteobacteria bacterium]
MTVPPTPTDEVARLQALHRYGILDTAPEEPFDNIARLAMTICGTAAADIAFIDDHRSWFKARINFPHAEVDRACALCNLAIQDAQGLVLADAWADPRLAGFPALHAEPPVRLFAGMPIVTPDGHAIGALCVMDPAPRALAPAAIEALRLLARQVVTELELRREVRERDRAEAGRRVADENFRRLVETMQEGVRVRDAHGVLTYVNPKLCELFGYTREEMLGQPVEAFMDAAEAARFRQCEMALATGDTSSFEFSAHHRDGHLIRVLVHPQPMSGADGAACGDFAVLTDVTALHTARRALEAARTSLEARVRERTGELESALREQRRAHEARRLYERIVEVSGDALACVSAQFRYLAVNTAFERFVGLPRAQILGRTVADVVGEALFERELRPRQQQALAGEQVHEVYWIDLPRRGRICVDVRYTPDYDPAGAVIGFVAAIREVTKRAQIEAELARQTRLLRGIVETAPVLVMVTDGDGRVELFNRACETLTGIDCTTALGRDLRTLLVPPDEQAAITARLAVIAAGGEVEPHENHWRAADGGQRLIEWHCAPLPGEPGPRLLGVGVDVTDARRAEQTLRESRTRLRTLTARLHSAREDERRAIARELHDEIGQTLTGLKIDVSEVLRRLPRGDPELVERMRSALMLVDESIDTLRRVTHGLHPPMLEDLGLEAAIEWQVEEYARRTGAEYRLHLDADDLEPDRERDTAVYRMLQEALTNISRHARASRVDVGLERHGRSLVLEVIDDGHGIDTTAIDAASSIGLMGMRERAAAFGGIVAISRAAGGGTALRVHLPLRGAASGREVGLDQGRTGG